MRVRVAASRPIRDYPGTNQPPAGQRVTTAILDWGVFLWGCVRVLLVALVLEWQGELFMKAIAAEGYPALANAFLVGWTAAIGLGVVLWFARQAREEARR